MGYRALCLMAGLLGAGMVKAEGPVDWLAQHAVKPYLLLEAEANYAEDYAGGSGSDVTLATAEFGLEAQLHEQLGATLSFLYEEGETDLEVDQAFVTLGDPDGLYLNAGRLYLPFGVVELHAHSSGLVSDPLTVDLAETRESALLLGYSTDTWRAMAYALNGATDVGGQDRLETFGMDLDFTGERAGLTYSLGFGYLNNIADTGSLAESVSNPTDLAGRTGGLDLHGSLGSGPFSVGFTYVAALERFAAVDLAFAEDGAKPAAWALDGAYHFKLAEMAAAFGLGYQGSRHALALELPEQRLLTALSLEPMAYTKVSLEWAHDQDYGLGDGGSGKSADSVTLQLAVEF